MAAWNEDVSQPPERRSRNKTSGWERLNVSCRAGIQESKMTSLLIKDQSRSGGVNRTTCRQRHKHLSFVSVCCGGGGRTKGGKSFRKTYLAQKRQMLRILTYNATLCISWKDYRHRTLSTPPTYRSTAALFARTGPKLYNCL